MTTVLQSQSNARNAQLATGPVSAEGKARVAHNARKHGFCASDVVMPGEDDARFARLLHRQHELWRPVDEEELELVDEIAAGHWRRWRLRLAESQLWAVRCGSGPDAVDKLGEAFASDCDTTANAIEKLRRWWQGNERHLHRCEERLRLMKKLADAGAYGKAKAGASPGYSRFIDAVIQHPLPGETPAQVAAQFDDSTKQTQSTHSQGNQGDAAGSEAEATGVSQNATTVPEPRTRAERRRLFRAQKKAEKRAGRG